MSLSVLAVCYHPHRMKSNDDCLNFIIASTCARVWDIFPVMCRSTASVLTCPGVNNKRNCRESIKTRDNFTYSGVFSLEPVVSTDPVDATSVFTTTAAKGYT